jgi:hypothetical protein
MGPILTLDFERVQIRNAERARYLLDVYAKGEANGRFAAMSHAHSQADVAGLPSDLHGKLPHLLAKKFSLITAGASGSALSGYGEAISIFGSPSGSGPDANQGFCLNLVSGAASGSQSGFHTVFGQYRVGRNCQFGIFARVMESASLIFWAVMTDGNLPTFNTNDPAANFFGFWYSTSAPDGEIQCAVKDGTSLRLVPSGVPWNNNMNLFEASMNDANGSATFKINGETVGMCDSNLPVADTVMRFVCGVTTLAAAARNIRIQRGVLIGDQ